MLLFQLNPLNDKNIKNYFKKIKSDFQTHSVI